MKRRDFVVGVPCSKLKPITDKIAHYIPCTREDEAMALAVGAYLAGKNPTVFLQNSGLGALVDIITSLLRPYGIKEIHLVISVRKRPAQHSYMGKITKKMLKILNYRNFKLVIE